MIKRTKRQRDRARKRDKRERERERKKGGEFGAEVAAQEVDHERE